MVECCVAAVWRHHDTEDTEDTGGLKLTPSQPRGASTASQQNTVQTSIHETDQLAVGGGDQTILVFIVARENTELQPSPRLILARRERER